MNIWEFLTSASYKNKEEEADGRLNMMLQLRYQVLNSNESVVISLRFLNQLQLMYQKEVSNFLVREILEMDKSL